MTRFRTFLLTDIEGSSALWERHPDEMDEALTRLDAIISEAVAAAGGVVHKTRGEGDSVFCTFDGADSGLVAAYEIQKALTGEERPIVELKVRIAVHSGDAVERGGDFFGPTVNRVARLRDIGHGGQVLTSEAAAEGASRPLPEGVHLADLGRHGLRDLSSPEHVYELRGPGLPSGFPALRSIRAFATNLPVQVTSFVGRERELRELVELVPDSPLVTLTAIGGAGKTRLALHAAAELLDNFPDGVWLVKLGDVNDPGLVVQTLADTVGAYDRLAEAGMGERARAVMEDRALEVLARRELLMVLDNCEHLIAECARIVDRVVHRCKDVRIVATSREPLGVEGERVFAVPSLSTSEGEDTAATPAAQLFVDRARLARPGFGIDESNTEAVASILTRLDGLPLAIELAASRVRNLSVDNLASRLDDAFRVLTGSGRGAVERHRTLEAAITWSFELLNEPERTLFRRLAVFAGGFTLQAAEDVCGFDPLEPQDVLDILSSLVDQSLVVYDEGRDRYRLYFVIGQFAARELARCGERETVARRHVDFFHPVAERAGLQALMLGGVEVLRAEIDNIRSALGWAIEDRDRTAALKIASAVGFGWIEAGLAREGAEWLTKALELPGRELGWDEHAQAQRALLYAVLWELPDWRESSASAESSLRALDPSTTTGYLQLMVSTRTLGLLVLAAGSAFAQDVQRGRDLINELEACDLDDWLESMRLLASMQIAMMDGATQEVLDLAPRTAAKADAVGNIVVKRWSAGFSAVALLLEDRLEESRQLLLPVIDETSEDSWSGAMLRWVLAVMEGRLGERAGARRLLRSVIGRARARGMVEVAHSSLLGATSILAQEGNLRDAGQLRGALDAFFERVGSSMAPGMLRLAADVDAGRRSRAYDQGYETGKKLSLTEALDVALSALAEVSSVESS